MTEKTPPPIDTVMLVDDEEIDQMLYGRIVERSTHADRILSFVSAGDALSHLVDGSAPRPDLVLLDVNMPGIDGFAFLDSLEREIDKEDAPVIVMLTTSFNPEDERRARSSSLVCGYKNKPLTDAMLGEFRKIVSEDARRVA